MTLIKITLLSKARNICKNKNQLSLMVLFFNSDIVSIQEKENDEEEKQEEETR